MDNASVNEVFATTLSELILKHYKLNFVPENAYIHCLDHVVSLVTQAIMNSLDEAEDPDKNDYFSGNKQYPTHYDEDDDEALKAFEQECEKDMDQYETLRTDGNTEYEDDDSIMAQILHDVDTWSPVKKASHFLRLIVTKICSSPQRRRKFRMIAKDVYKDQRAPSGHKLAFLMAIRDIITRWNYTHAMIKRALLLQKWNMLERLGKVLEVFTQVTLQMSRSTTPTLPWVLPMYEMMRRHLSTTNDDLTQLPQIRTAALVGLMKLDKYYFKAKFNQYNVIATMLHPHLGLRWFRRLNDPDRATRAKILFEAVYKEYKDAANKEDRASVQNLVPPRKKISSFLSDVMMNDVSSDSETDPIASASLASECDRFYIAYKTIDQGDENDPLAW
ncbi:uncharacterized protein EV420DRAFT_1272158 [Desarmillaria tabescens]|uniref:Uncharacterized protein n=1 Tax=Armillaria tabescens TaxID=1929756 RepID=A0AA39N2B7_ARMTA|nr:uncharacterized protein EV420DRAFT_1272158 [Desarmillaria tabescens]KAK0455611.1 hypothetical protein EV420DRAFT_1272158 [Desarmillaria tabescens]